LISSGGRSADTEPAFHVRQQAQPQHAGHLLCKTEKRWAPDSFIQKSEIFWMSLLRSSMPAGRPHGPRERLRRHQAQRRAAMNK
jgi:hypothetical protein